MRRDSRSAVPTPQLPMLKLDHFYITVTNLDEAIIFYEQLLGMKISHRESDRWADFQKDNAIYFGIFNCTIDQEEFTTGTSPTLCLKTEDIEQEYNRIKNIGVKSISQIITLTQPNLYRYFQFEDKWGNNWEVATYNY